ncbi:MAG: DUF308 domain-containing protein [Lachnospiraceae bacterium]|nr:DUF308 domain-containing protein [Lachnospiraceae bacterium]
MSFIKEQKGTVIRSIILIIAGVVLLFYPEMASNTLAYGIAFVFIVMGIVNIVGYFRQSDKALGGYDYGLVIGILLIVFALLISKVLISLIPIILGFIVLFSGLMKLQQMCELLRHEVEGWIPVAVMAGVNIIAGCLAIFNPFKTVNLLLRIVGVGLLFGGITDLIASGYVSKKIKTEDGHEIITTTGNIDEI